MNRSPHRPSHVGGVPTGIRTPVTAVKGRCPRPLDDGDGIVRNASRAWLCANWAFLEATTESKIDGRQCKDARTAGQIVGTNLVRLTVNDDYKAACLACADAT
jgi:hypothetical protein